MGHHLGVDEPRVLQLEGKDTLAVLAYHAVGDYVWFTSDHSIAHIEERYSFLARTDITGRKEQLIAVNIDQAITAYEALYAYTMGGALASGDSETRGSITTGKWGDLVVLSGDPLATDPADLPNIQVEQTYVGGRLVYER